MTREEAIKLDKLVGEIIDLAKKGPECRSDVRIEAKRAEFQQLLANYVTEGQVPIQYRQPDDRTYGRQSSIKRGERY
jgi:hypothetical protein